MSTHAAGTFSLKSWEENPYDEFGEGMKLARASVVQTFEGEIEGEGAAEMLMMYPDESSATYVGLQRIVGSVGGRKGTFVFHIAGVFDGGTASSKVSVVPGSGTDELRGLEGRGEANAGHGMGPHPITFDYDLK